MSIPVQPTYVTYTNHSTLKPPECCCSATSKSCCIAWHIIFAVLQIILLAILAIALVLVPSVLQANTGQLTSAAKQALDSYYKFGIAACVLQGFSALINLICAGLLMNDNAKQIKISIFVYILAYIVSVIFSYVSAASLSVNTNIISSIVGTVIGVLIMLTIAWNSYRHAVYLEKVQAAGGGAIRA